MKVIFLIFSLFLMTFQKLNVLIYSNYKMR